MSNTDKNSQNNDSSHNNRKEDNPNWKLKFQDILNTCQEEIKRTTAITKKMLNASASNSKLNDTYQELGRLCAKNIESKFLVWENSQAKKLMETIRELEEQLNEFEQDVHDIKGQSFETDLGNNSENTTESSDKGEDSSKN